MLMRPWLNGKLNNGFKISVSLIVLGGLLSSGPEALATPPVPGPLPQTVITPPTQTASLIPGANALPPAQPQYINQPAAQPMARPPVQPFAPMNPAPVRAITGPAMVTPLNRLPLNPVMGAQVVDGELRILAPPGAQLLVKNRFVLQNPTRMVVDLDRAELPAKTINIPAGQLGPMPYNNIRLSQFDDTTVRLVVEAHHADKLNITLGRGTNNLLRVFAPQPSSLASRFFHRVIGRPTQPRGPQIAYTSPTTQGVITDARPLMGPPIAMPGTPLNRLRVLDIARSQLGVSKANNRDYVNNTFSRGKDQAWCADFVSTVMNWAGGSPWGHTAMVRDIYDWGLANQRLKPVPEPGDMAVFRYGGSGFDHIAFVEGIGPDNMVVTIGGNEGGSSGLAPGGMVNRARYKVDDSRILGYVTPY